MDKTRNLVASAIRFYDFFIPIGALPFLIIDMGDDDLKSLFSHPIQKSHGIGAARTSHYDFFTHVYSIVVRQQSCKALLESV